MLCRWGQQIWNKARINFKRDSTGLESASGASAPRPDSGPALCHVGFASERDHVEHQFTLYEEMRAPLYMRVNAN